MSTLQTVLDAVTDLTVSVRPGSGYPGALRNIEFFASAATPFRSDVVYLLPETETENAVSALPPTSVCFISCAGAPPDTAELPRGCTAVFVRCELMPLYARLNRCLELHRLRERIDDILLMAENAQYSPDQLVIALSQMLDIGVFMLGPSYQRINGPLSEYSANPFVQELVRTGVLSADSVQRIRNGIGDTPAVLYEAEGGKWVRFFVLVLWRDGAYVDTQYLCRCLTNYVLDYDKRRTPPEIPPFLLDHRLNRVLEGKTASVSEVRAFFGTGSAPCWFSVLILGAEPGVRWSAEAYQRQGRLLRSAFRQSWITVIRSQVCAVVMLPIQRPQDAVYSRDYFSANAYAEGWDKARLERELQQCGVYLCHSPIFQSYGFFPIEFSLTSDALDLAIRLDGPLGRRIVSFHEYSPYISIKYSVERFLQVNEARSLRALLYPEMVTLLLHDLKYNTDLADVLYLYYTYGDVNRTAQTLFVHRNTVYNKLKAVHKILNVDLDNPSVRSSFVNSMRLFYYCEKCLGVDLRTPE